MSHSADIEPQAGQLLAVGGRAPEVCPVRSIRIWSERKQQNLTIDCEPLTWFARHLAEAAHEAEHGHDGQDGGKARDPQYLLNGPETNRAILTLALERARSAIQEEQSAAKETLDKPLPFG